MSYVTRGLRPFLLHALHLMISIPAYSQTNTAADTPVTWDQVKPVLQKHCFACHRGEQARGGLDLSTVAGIRSGSTSGAAVVAGMPDQSLIYTLAAHLENPTMPPNRPKVPQRELDLLYGWIEGGLSEKPAATDENSKNSMKSGNLRLRPTTPGTTFSPKNLPALVKSSPAEVKLSAANEWVPAPRVPRRQNQPRPLLTPAVTALAVSPTASLAAISGDHEVLLYQWTDQQLRDRFPFPEGDVFTLKFSADGTLLLAGGGVGAESGTVVAFDVATGDRVFQIGNESDIVLTADLSPDGRRMAIGGPSRTVKLFDTVTHEQIAEIRKHTDWVTSLQFSHDGLLLASGDRFGSVYVWEAGSRNEFVNLRGHTGTISNVLWSADSNQLVSAGQDGTIRYWDMHQGIQTDQQSGHVGEIMTADLDAAGGIVCGGRSRRICIRPPRSALDAANRHRTTAVSQDSSTESDGRNQILTIEMPDVVVKLAITHDRTLLIAADAIGNVKLFHFETGAPAGELLLPEIGGSVTR